MNQQQTEMYRALSSVLVKHHAHILRFEYYKKYFGDFKVEIEYQGEKHIFATDRGEVYFDGNQLCDNSYHVAGVSDTFSKLLEMIDFHFSSLEKR